MMTDGFREVLLPPTLLNQLDLYDLQPLPRWEYTHSHLQYLYIVVPTLVLQEVHQPPKRLEVLEELIHLIGIWGREGIPVLQLGEIGSYARQPSRCVLQEPPSACVQGEVHDHDSAHLHAYPYVELVEELLAESALISYTYIPIYILYI